MNDCSGEHFKELAQGEKVFGPSRFSKSIYIILIQTTG